MAFSIDNNSIVKFRASRCFGAGRCDTGLSLDLFKDLNLKIEGTASYLYVSRVLLAAFFKCSSLKWYSHITLFLLDGSNVSPPPLLRYIPIVLTQHWYFCGFLSLDGLT